MSSKSHNLIQLLKSRGFINHISLTFNKKTYYANDYGAPGTLMRQNIKNQWWKAMVLLQSNVFPVETSPIQLENHLSVLKSIENDQSQFNIPGNNIHDDCQRKYLDILTLTNKRLPFSIATIGECLKKPAAECDTSTTLESTFFLRHLITTKMILQNYVPPSGVSRIFDYWLQMRLSWWKKFSNNPSKLSVTSSSTNGNSKLEKINGMSNSVDDRQHMSIVYDFPWGPEALEVVRNTGDNELIRLQEEKNENFTARVPNSNKSYLPHCIKCTANLEMAMAHFLVDGYHERKPLSKFKSDAQALPILQLHPHLSPFQVALVITTNQSTTSKELCHISKQLEQDLLKAGVSVFNAAEHVGTLNAHFKRNDQLGIPYTLILNENTLKDGVINSRDRDTEIKKPVHVSKAVEEISRNVKAILE